MFFALEDDVDAVEVSPARLRGGRSAVARTAPRGGFVEVDARSAARAFAEVARAAFRALARVVVDALNNDPDAEADISTAADEFRGVRASIYRGRAFGLVLRGDESSRARPGSAVARNPRKSRRVGRARADLCRSRAR